MDAGEASRGLMGRCWQGQPWNPALAADFGADRLLRESKTGLPRLPIRSLEPKQLQLREGLGRELAYSAERVLGGGPEVEVGIFLPPEGDAGVAEARAEGGELLQAALGFGAIRVEGTGGG